MKKIREQMVKAGYEVSEHCSHLGNQWGWYSPVDHKTHIPGQELAWKAAEQAFKAELKRAAVLIELVKNDH